MHCMLFCDVQRNAQKYICMTCRLCCSRPCAALKVVWHPMQQRERLEKSPCPRRSFQSSEGTLCVLERKLPHAATLIKRSQVHLQGTNMPLMYLNVILNWPSSSARQYFLAGTIDHHWIVGMLISSVGKAVDCSYSNFTYYMIWGHLWCADLHLSYWLWLGFHAACYCVQIWEQCGCSTHGAVCRWHLSCSDWGRGLPLFATVTRKACAKAAWIWPKRSGVLCGNQLHWGMSEALLAYADALLATLCDQLAWLRMKQLNLQLSQPCDSPSRD